MKKPNRIKPGHYWSAIDKHGKQLWGATNRREVERMTKGQFPRIIQKPKIQPSEAITHSAYEET